MHGLGFSSLVVLAVAISNVRGHANVTSPAIRTPGAKHQQVCGQQSFSVVSQDPTGHIEEQLPVATDACELTLCRGMLFADQPASHVQKVSPGQAMAMSVDCTIPHGGPANVTLVDTTTGGNGRAIGSALTSFADFCPTSGGIPANQSNLQFNLPQADVIGNSCQAAGDCVVQLFWSTPDGTQNYYYCVDVAVSSPPASTVAPPASSSASASSSSAPVASAPPTAAPPQSAPVVVGAPASNPPVAGSAPPSAAPVSCPVSPKKKRTNVNKARSAKRAATKRAGMQSRANKSRARVASGAA